MWSTLSSLRWKNGRTKTDRALEDCRHTEVERKRRKPLQEKKNLNWIISWDKKGGECDYLINYTFISCVDPVIDNEVNYVLQMEVGLSISPTDMYLQPRQRKLKIVFNNLNYFMHPPDCRFRLKLTNFKHLLDSYNIVAFMKSTQIDLNCNPGIRWTRHGIILLTLNE